MSEADPRIPGDAAPAELGATAAKSPAAAPPRKRRRLLLMLSVPLLLLLAGGYLWFSSGRYISTDDAYVQQDLVPIAPEVGGRIVEVGVVENQLVHKGDLLLRINPQPYRIALAQAEAQIAAAGVQVNELQTERTGTGGNIAGAERNLVYARRDFDREAALLRQGFTTRSMYDDALHAFEEARQRLSDARAARANASAELREGPASNQPALMAARAARDQALLNLARTEIRAPADGRVSQTNDVEVGAMAIAGAPLLTLVGADPYVEAEYKETDLARMHVGQPAGIEIDAYPGLHVAGHVLSIGVGTGSQFSIIPAQNATGNWVKVTQRVPVRISIDGNPGRAMIAGLSAKVSIDTRAPAARPPRR